jgi:hypothetical protein
MKLQIDTATKTIRVEHIVNLGELVTALANMFPDGAWREYSIEPSVIQNWTSPIWVDPNPIQPNIPLYPWQQQPILYGTAPDTNVFCVQYGGDQP